MSGGDEQSAAVRRRLQRSYFKAFARAHGRLLLRTKGRPSSLGRGRHACVLQTTGRRTGLPRSVPLLYMPFGEALVVVASNYGQERPPAWWWNLEADPRAYVLLGGSRIDVVARETEGEERAMLIERGAVYNKMWSQYFDNVERHLPVVSLDPGTDAS